jgi:hypothetical protein
MNWKLQQVTERVKSRHFGAATIKPRSFKLIAQQ